MKATICTHPWYFLFYIVLFVGNHASPFFQWPNPHLSLVAAPCNPNPNPNQKSEGETLCSNKWNEFRVWLAPDDTMKKREQFLFV